MLDSYSNNQETIRDIKHSRVLAPFIKSVCNKEELLERYQYRLDEDGEPNCE